MAKEKPSQEERAADFLLKEVDEEVRAEQLRSWWQRFGNWLVGAAILVVLATVGHEVWQGQKHQAGEQATEAMLKAAELQQQNRSGDAAQLLEETSATGAMAILLKLQQAEHLMAAGQKEEATALLTEVSNQTELPAFQHYARMQLGNDLNTSPDNPLYHTAREMEAMRLATAGKKEEARDMLEKLAQNPTTPPSITQRAEQLLRIYH